MAAAKNGRVSGGRAVGRKVEIRCSECEADAVDYGALCSAGIPFVLLINVLTAADGDGAELRTGRLIPGLGGERTEEKANGYRGCTGLKDVLGHREHTPCFYLVDSDTPN